MCDAITRRDFLRSALIGGVAVGAGLTHPYWARMALAQSAAIRFSTWHPPLSREVKTVWQPMLDDLKKRSGGKINYTMFAGAALGKGPEHYDIVAKGLSDMGYFTATWTPGRFPLTDVLSLAVSIDGKDISTEIGNAMYDRMLGKEFQGVKVVELNGCIQSFIWSKKPIAKMADVRGLKLRTPGGQQTHYIKSLGAEPVFMPLGDVYMAVETGTIDGIVTCPPLVLAYKLHEVAKYGTAATFGCVSEGVVMNQNTWNRLGTENQKVVMDVCHNPFKTTGGLGQADYKVMMKEIEGAGVKLVELSRSEAGAWADRFKDVTRQWVKELEGKGLPARQTVSAFNEECEKRGVTVPAFPPELRKS
jgi:TRAP-type transport system periplasmic protein